MNITSNRVHKIQPSPTLAITALAQQLKAAGKNVINFGAGEPDFDTPEHIKLACKKAIDEGYTKYDNVQGNIKCRESISKLYLQEYQLSFNPQEIIVTVGAKQALYNLFMATLNKQDEVIIPSPYWVSYIDIIQLTGASSTIIPTQIDTSYKITPEQLEKAITPQTKFFILNSPANPTGALYSKTELLSLVQVLEKHPHVFIVLDEIYDKIIYDNVSYHSIATLSPNLLERCIIINGLSKTFAMTGWRIGYALSKNQNIIKAMSKIQSQSTSSVTTFIQIASSYALDQGFEFNKSRLKTLQERRDYVYNQLSKLSLLKVPKPEGAFYIFPDISLLDNTNFIIEYKKKHPDNLDLSKIFAKILLEDYEVAIIPGIAFGHSPAFRMSYAISMENIKLGIERIEKFFTSIVNV